MLVTAKALYLNQIAEDVIINPEEVVPEPVRQLIDNTRRVKVLQQGLLPRALQYLFVLLRSSSSSVKCFVTFMEIYNEKVFDLVNNTGAQLEVHQRPEQDKGFYVPRLSQVECKGVNDAMQVLCQGVTSRHTRGHSASRESSRAHAIFFVDLVHQGGKKTGRLIFADLAGSERIKRISGADTQETAHINKALLQLSNCVSGLSSVAQDAENGRRSSLNGSSKNNIASSFRNSKLTKVLMESLCGTGYTLLLAAASPAKRHFDETANTFFFAAKCANIKRQVVTNLSPHEREVQELQQTIRSLRLELAKCKASAAPNVALSRTFSFSDAPDVNMALVVEERDELRARLEAQELRNEALRQEVTSMMHIVASFSNSNKLQQASAV